MSRPGPGRPPSDAVYVPDDGELGPYELVLEPARYGWHVSVKRGLLIWGLGLTAAPWWRPTKAWAARKGQRVIRQLEAEAERRSRREVIR
jgi:hypothetical protein